MIDAVATFLATHLYTLNVRRVYLRICCLDDQTVFSVVLRIELDCHLVECRQCKRILWNTRTVGIEAIMLNIAHDDIVPVSSLPGIPSGLVV